MLDHLASLLTVTRTTYVQLELTTNCNLRCAYCAVSSAAWRPETMNVSSLAALLDVLQRRETQVVVINGHGETTTLPYWREVAEMVIERGIGTGICSNFCKQFSAEELHTLARFSGITISCDTADPDVFKRLRGGDLRTLIFNLVQLRAICYPDPPPDFIWSCVLCDQTVDGLIDYIRLGLSLGIRKFFLCNLGVVDLPGPRPRHLSTLPIEKQHAASLILAEVKALCDAAGATLKVDGGLDQIGVAKWE